MDTQKYQIYQEKYPIKSEIYPVVQGFQPAGRSYQYMEDINYLHKYAQKADHRHQPPVVAKKLFPETLLYLIRYTHQYFQILHKNSPSLFCELL